MKHVLIDLVNQIRKTNPVDDHGHNFTMNRAYLEAVKYLDNISQPVQPASQLRLEAALERAGAAESALRRLVDECENENIPGWEDRMIECIDNANKLLSAQPEQPSPQSQ